MINNIHNNNNNENIALNWFSIKSSKCIANFSELNSICHWLFAADWLKPFTFTLYWYSNFSTSSKCKIFFAILGVRLDFDILQTKRSIKEILIRLIYIDSKKIIRTGIYWAHFFSINVFKNQTVRAAKSELYNFHVKGNTHYLGSAAKEWIYFFMLLWCGLSIIGSTIQH